MELHPRNGTLTKKKQEQWAQERADKIQSGEWYPFGSPGGGSPNRKHATISYDSKLKEENAGKNISSKSGTETSVEIVDQSIDPPMSQMISFPPDILPVPNRSPQENDINLINNSSILHNSYPAAISAWPPGTLPYAYNLLPPGVIPIPINMPSQPGSSDGNKDAAYCPPFLPGYAGNFFFPPAAYFGNKQNEVNKNILNDQDNNNVHDNNQQTPSQLSSINQSLSSTNDSQSKDPSPREREEHIHNHPKENDENHIDSEEHFILERKMREDNEKTGQQENNSKKRRESQLAEAWEKAKHESEVLKKAKLFKHVLEGNDRSPELEKKILGVDSTTGNRILNEINQWERHKKREHQAIEKARESRKSQDSARSTSARSQSSPAKHRSKSVDIDSRINPNRMDSTTEANKQSVNEPARGNQNSHIPLSRNAYNRLSLRSSKSVTTSKEGFRHIPPMNNCQVGINKHSTHTPHPRDNTESRIPVPQARRAPTQVITNDREDVSVNSCNQENQSAQSSIRRTPKRSGDKNHLEDQKNPLLNPIATRKMRPNAKNLSNLSGTVGSLDSNEETSSGSECHVSPNSSPVPSIVIDTNDAKKSIVPEIQTTPKAPSNALRSRSAFNSPNFGTPLNGGLRAAIYKQKIGQKGCSNHEEDTLSPDVRRKAEASLSRTSSMSSLRGSISNLRGSMSNLNINVADSPAFGRFKSMNPAYRSFNNKKSSDRQKATLERLALLREQLRAKENFLDSNSVCSTPGKP